MECKFDSIYEYMLTPDIHFTLKGNVFALDIAVSTKDRNNLFGRRFFIMTLIFFIMLAYIIKLFNWCLDTMPYDNYAYNHYFS